MTFEQFNTSYDRLRAWLQSRGLDMVHTKAELYAYLAEEISADDLKQLKTLSHPDRVMAEIEERMKYT